MNVLITTYNGNISSFKRIDNFFALIFKKVLIKDQAVDIK